ncbi:MAG TPA: AbrB/MazE/SpoVT family DNA-binding domain-containing protein [Mycobacterium sp.]|nr:AbrB/MazE/SpoVT family DNA-binding domain-containing protein [Mycobacterium sp.]
MREVDDVAHSARVAIRCVVRHTPAEIRATLGLSPGDRVHLHLDGHRLVIERPQDAVAELRRLGSGLSRSRSLVDELLAERRAAAETE